MTHTDDALAAARNRPGFMERLAKRMQEDRAILNKLEASEHAEANRIVDAVMAEVRRLANHECRYPQPNDQGFPVGQCLDCGRWRELGR